MKAARTPVLALALLGGCGPALEVVTFSPPERVECVADCLKTCAVPQKDNDCPLPPKSAKEGAKP